MKAHCFRSVVFLAGLLVVVIILLTYQTDKVFIYRISSDTIFMSPEQRPIKRDQTFTALATSKSTLSSSTPTPKPTQGTGMGVHDSQEIEEIYREDISTSAALGVDEDVSTWASKQQGFKNKGITVSSRPGNALLNHTFDIQSIGRLQNEYTQTTTNVLLVTYLRSGSTWLGDITRQAENSFYVYEPFKNLIKQGYYANNSVCFNDNTCRGPITDHEHDQVAIESLRQIYTCDFLNMNKVVLNNVVRSQMKDCQQLRRTSHTFVPLTRQMQLSECIKYTTQKCFQAKYRIAKTIRFSMELIETLMTNVENLKVINLVRDPRGISNSRVHGRYSMTLNNVVPHSINMCTRMYNDVIIGDRLRNKYPDKLALVMYEALAERPMEGARYVFKFLNATYSDKVQQWVYDSSHGNSNGFYATTRNSSAALSHWRSELTFARIISIQNNCENLFNLLGYISFKTIGDLRDFEKKSRITAYRSGFL